MFFHDLAEPGEAWTEYEKLLSELSKFVGDCVRYLVDAFNVAHAKAAQEKCSSHTTVLMLVRHVIESIDGVSVLVQKGCAENCGPLLRSAFEGELAVLYILQTDSKRRALAYQVAHAHRRIKLYRKCDPNDALGEELRNELKDDPMSTLLGSLPLDWKAMVANLENMLELPEFEPIEEEWQRIRTTTRKDPEWFALFGGPRDVRSLAKSLRLGAAYEGLYRSWSDIIHAGSGLKHVGPSDRPGAIAIRPIRHPDGLENACVFAATFCLTTARILVQTYSPGELERFGIKYVEQIRNRYQQLQQGNLINAPWRSDRLQP